LVLLLCFKLGLSREAFVASETLVECSEEEEEDKEKLVTTDIGKEQHLCQIEKAAGGSWGSWNMASSLRYFFWRP
jgi:hypothetical protein